MSNFGLAINCNGAIPSPQDFADLGLDSGDWVRTPIQGSLTLLDQLWPNLPNGLNVMVDLNNECHEVGGDWLGWEDACRIIAERYSSRVRIVGCGNELDLWFDRGDRNLTPSFAASLVRRASPILRSAGIKVATNGVASGNWQEYLAEMVNECRDELDYANLHLYAKSAGGIPSPDWQSVGDAWQRARDLTGKPVICSEAGIKVDDAGGLDRQAQWARGLFDWAESVSTDDCPMVAYFAWSDGIGTSDEQGGQAFGALDPHGNRKPVWQALQESYMGPTPLPTPPVPLPPVWRFEEGFLLWSQVEPELLGRPAEASEHGGITGFSQLETTTGILTWADLKAGEVFTLFHRPTQTRRRWQKGWSTSLVM
jgi:hypothetical protein